MGVAVSPGRSVMAADAAGRRRRQLKHRLLLFRKRVDGRLMVRGVGRSLPYREDGKERRQNEKRRERGLLSCH